MGFCESCVNGQDLQPGDQCNACGRVGTANDSGLNWPMSEEEATESRLRDEECRHEPDCA